MIWVAISGALLVAAALVSSFVAAFDEKAWDELEAILGGVWRMHSLAILTLGMLGFALLVFGALSLPR